MRPRIRQQEIEALVAGTADAAFAVDADGRIVAWNTASTVLFGRSPREAIGHPCGSIVQGTDSAGPVCGAACCCVRTASQRSRPMPNFDLHVATASGQRWCNISVILVDGRGQAAPVSIHIFRDVDTRKRLDLLMRDFVATGGAGPLAEPIRHADVERNAARCVELSRQEATGLGLLAAGAATRDIAESLHISPVTVNNHVQHAMEKLGAHTRLEAIRRAERAGLL